MIAVGSSAYGELSGQAEIITDDRSLFERILSPLKYLLKEHAK